jgi:hypothetical protein
MARSNVDPDRGADKRNMADLFFIGLAGKTLGEMI